MGGVERPVVFCGSRAAVDSSFSNPAVELGLSAVDGFMAAETSAAVAGANSINAAMAVVRG